MGDESIMMHMSYWSRFIAFHHVGHVSEDIYPLLLGCWTNPNHKLASTGKELSIGASIRTV